MGLLDDELGAAFGVFPQMKPRRRFQDPEASANVPLDITRGRLAGLLGLLPDTLNFMGRSPMPTEMFGETQYEPAPQLPYGSEYYLENLPLKPTSRVGEVAGQAGAFVPLNPMPAARAVAAGARALGPTAVRMGEGYLQRQGLMPSVVEGESAGMLGGPIKPQAPVSPLGFYSAAEQATLNIPRKSGTGESFLNDLMKGQDVKKEELSWLGLDDYLKGKPNVTRQEVQDYIAGNRVDVQEVRLGEAPSYDKIRLATLENELSQLKEHPIDAPTFGEEKFNELLKLQNIRDQSTVDSLYSGAEVAIRNAQRAQAAGNKELANKYFLESEMFNTRAEALDLKGLGVPNPTKYGQYQLPGGENYREILLTLPNQWDKPRAAQIANEERIKALRQEMYGTSGTNEIRSEISRLQNENTSLQRQISEAPIYKSSHFDEPNILAHMRVNDRVDADGKKMLLIEEIQSDWHQAGREKGYENPKVEERRKELEKLAWPYMEANKPIPAEIKAEIDALPPIMQKGVPDAPFKDTWHQLALKRALKYAADNGYDRVGLTTGRQQIERYANELRQNVDEIVFQTGQKLTDIEAAELKALRQKTFRDMTGTERAKFDSLSSQEGSSIRPDEIKIKAYKGGSNTFDGKVKNGKFIEGPAQGKTVEEVLGKSMAKQIAEQRTGTIKGDDLTIGGEGMKAYYDEIYPAFLAKQGKKYNAKTGETTIGKKGTIEKAGRSYYQTPDTNATVRYIDISPEMRGGVKKGQPLFTAAPIGGIGLGAGMQDNEMPEAVRQYMANPTPGLLQDEDERKLGGLLYR